jgi:uncharacterized protein YjgD (DUF1641 family)
MVDSPTPDIVRLAQAASDAMTDGMVERLSDTAANSLDVVDRLNDEDTREAIHALLDGVTQMHRSGSMETVFELVGMLHGARSAMTDSMVERMFIFVEHMMNNLANEEIAAMAHNARRAMEEAVDVTHEKGKAKGGMISTISMLSKPETQQALQFVLAFACKMQARSSDTHGKFDHEDV